MSAEKKILKKQTLVDALESLSDGERRFVVGWSRGSSPLEAAAAAYPGLGEGDLFVRVKDLTTNPAVVSARKLLVRGVGAAGLVPGVDDLSAMLWEAWELARAQERVGDMVKVVSVMAKLGGMSEERSSRPGVAVQTNNFINLPDRDGSDFEGVVGRLSGEHSRRGQSALPGEEVSGKVVK